MSASEVLLIRQLAYAQVPLLSVQGAEPRCKLVVPFGRLWGTLFGLATSV